MVATAPLRLFLALSSVAAVLCQDDISAEASKVIEKDVIIIGGGAAGSHAAVRLREDYGKSVVLIERESKLVRMA